MTQRIKRRRLSSQHGTNGLLQDSNAYLDDICRPASTAEKETWNGFCEIESEPVRSLEQAWILYFNPPQVNPNVLEGSFQRNAPRIWSQGRQSAGSCIIRRRNDGLS